MTTATLSTQLDQLGFTGFKTALLRQSEDANYARLPFEERLYQLLEAEQNERSDKKIKRLLSQAKLKDNQAMLEELEYSAKRGLDRSVILSLASCEYISKGQNILITGATGVGKSFLAQAFAKRAIFEGYSARYYRITRLLEEIKLARLDGTYTKALSKISKYALLILDDFGVTPLKADEINDLFEVVEERTLFGSTIITAQLPVKEWHAYLGNETIADAMMDRLIYSAHRIEMKGESMRKMMAEKVEA
jgi:DNA replication protein DnaC